MATECQLAGTMKVYTGCGYEVSRGGSRLQMFSGDRVDGEGRSIVYST